MKFANNSANTNGKIPTLVAFDGPCVFCSLHYFGTSANGFIMLFDSRTLPLPGERPKRQWPIVELNAFDHEASSGIPMQNGIVVATSLTQHYYTVAISDPIIDVTFYVPPPPPPPKLDPTPEALAVHPSPAPQRPPPASTPPGRPAQTSKPLKGTVAALLLAFLTLLPSGKAASWQTGPDSLNAAVLNLQAATNALNTRWYNLFSITNDVVTTGVVSVVSILSNYTGTVTLPANFWTPGKTVELHLRGNTFSPAAGAAYTNALLLGSTVVATNLVYIGNYSLGEQIEFHLSITCRTTGASGSVISMGHVGSASTAGGNTGAWRRMYLASGAVTIDTTASMVLDLTVHAPLAHSLSIRSGYGTVIP